MSRSREELLALLGAKTAEDDCLDEDEFEDDIPEEAPRGKSKPAGKKSRQGKKAAGEEEEEEEQKPFYRLSQPGPNHYEAPTPIGFVPPKDFLKPDVQDKFIPKNSFIGDFVHCLKGYESPVLFNIWGALYAVSVMSGRQSWFRFGRDKLWPNLFLIWIAKPGVCKKSTALGLATRLIQELPSRYEDDPYMREAKSIDYITSKATADSLFMSLKPKFRAFLLPDGSVFSENFGSRTYVSASELATFLNVKKFNTGLVDTLTDLYDCKERDRELTRVRGIEEFNNFFFCLGGACTPMHMQTAFPPEAMGGGFMSRCILIHQEFPSVWHPLPEVYEGFPTQETLLDRLVWLSYNTRGEYYLTEEAMAEYSKWYRSWREDLFTRGVQDDALAETRQDVLTLKVATLIRMCEYREGHDVTLQNYLDARELLTYTLSHANQVARGLGAKERQTTYLKIRNYVQKYQKLNRRKLLSLCSPRGIYVSEINPALTQLVQEGLVNIMMNNIPRPMPGSQPEEMYMWCGLSQDEERHEHQVQLGGT